MRAPLFNAETVRRYELPADPRERMAWTLRKMAELARATIHDPRFRMRVLNAALANAAPRDEAGQAAALLDWVRARIAYVKDPVGVEWPQSPSVALRVGAGDCDDLSTCYAAAVMAIGIPARFVAATGKANDPEWRHVWTEILLDGRWVPVDASHPTAPIGWQVQPQFRRAVLEVADENAQISGFFDDVVHAVTHPIGELLEGVRDVVGLIDKFDQYAWNHMGGTMRSIVSTIGPMVAAYYVPYVGKQLAETAIAWRESRRLSKKERNKLRAEMENALADLEARGFLAPGAIDLDNDEDVQALIYAGKMPDDVKAAWLAQNGYAPGATVDNPIRAGAALPRPGASRGGLVLVAAALGLAYWVAS